MKPLLLRFIPLVLISILPFEVFATPVMSESRGVAFPVAVVEGTTAVSTYTVTNNTPVNFTGVTLQKLAGATQVTGDGLCAQAPFALNAGASCTLQLDYSASTAGQVVGGPEVCPDNTRINCSQPIEVQRIVFSVMPTPEPSMPTLGIPANLQLIPGSYSDIQISNNSSTTVANNVTVSMPDSLRAKFDSVGACETIAKGASCILRMKPKSSLSSLPVSSVTVHGSNTQDATLPIELASVELTVPSSLQLVPGEQATLPITNNSSTVTASNVSLTMPSSLASQFSSIGTCASIAPEATCNLMLTPKSTLSALPVNTISVSGSNTQSTDLPLTLASVSLLASNLIFNAAGEQSLTLTNEGDVSVTVSQVALANTIDNITVGAIPNACTNLSAGNSCTVAITAASSSYGSGGISTSYTTGSRSLIATSTLSVANTSLSVNAGDDIELRPTASKTVSIENTGNFDWHGATVSLSALPNASLDATGCTDENLSPGATCDLDFTTTNTTPAATSTVTATGDNIGSTSANVVVDGGVAIALDANNEHLQDRAIEIDNVGDTNKTLSDPIVNVSEGLTNRIVNCPSGGSNCNYQSTCVAGATLNAGSSCLVWLEAQEPSAEGLGSIDGTVTIDATADDYQTFDLTYGLDLYLASENKTAAITYGSVYRWDGTTSTGIGDSSSGSFSTGFASLVSYQGDLYVGGKFSTAGGVAASNAAKWDGSAWTALGTGLTGGSDSVSALTVYDDELIAGGNFSTAGGVTARLVAAWNGSAWSNLGAGDTSNATVYALHVYDGDLIAAGSFVEIRNKLANRIAKWDGSDWLPLSDGIVAPYVLALTTYDNDLIAGGLFPTAGAATVSNVAKWNGTAWSALGDGSNSTIQDFAEYDGNLIAAGNFTMIGGVAANRIAEWSGAEWSALGGATFNSYFNTATSYGNNLFVGGRFTVPVQYAGVWNGAATWSAIDFGGNIANQDPKDSDVMPSIVSIRAQ